MFRKKRASSNPPIQQPPSTTSSATSAAAIAFLNKRASNASLSSAAAAAALRSHTTSPEPVGSIQTKRMIRRGSTASYGSPPPNVRQPFSSGVQRPGMQRSGSISSMTSRTFRSPSPGGRNPLLSSTTPADAPPIPNKSHKRTPSSDLPSPTVPPPRVASAQAHYADMTRNNNAQPATTIRYDPNTRTLIRVPIQTPASAASANTRSINFSRPMSPPLTQAARPREPVRARPATAQGFSSSETLRSATPALPASLRQKAAAARASAGIENVPALVAASTAARASPAAPAVATARTTPTVSKPLQDPTPINTTSTTIASPSSTSTVPKTVGPPATTVTRPPPPSPAPAIPPPSPDEIKSFQTRAAAMLARPRTDAAATAAVTSKPAQGPTAPSSIAVGSSSAPPVAQPLSTAVKPISQPVAVSQLALPSSTTAAAASSHSPTRSAHFSESPLVENIKHQPPPRALSPAKSALKAPSPRTASPAGSTSKAMSDTSETRSDDGSTTGQRRKKSVKVSFDASPILVGEAASPATPLNTLTSPQYRKNLADPWASDDDEHQYAPRPVLPSFGSIRGKTPTPDREASPAVASREILPSSEAPLASELPQEQPAPVAVPAEAERPKLTSRQPSDHADLGGLLAKAFLPKQGPNAPAEANDAASEAGLPAISVVPATPMVDQEGQEFLSGPATTGTIASEPVDINRPFKGRFIQAVPQPSYEMQQAAEDFESDDNVEQFADAAEDHVDADAQGVGFTSLDSIMESPTAELSGSQNQSGNGIREILMAREEPEMVVPPASGTVQNSSQAVESEEWDRVRQYWNSLSEDRKQQLEREAAMNSSTPALTASANQASHAPPLPPWPDQEYQKSVTTQPVPALKSTMRAGHERSGSEPHHWRTSLRDGQRPMSTNLESRAKTASTPRPKSALVATAASSASAAALTSQTPVASRTLTKPKLERTLSNESSASDSSFRRQRRASIASSDGGGFSMRRTMRGSTDTGTRPSQPTSTGRLEPQSRSAASGKPARMSLRAGADSDGPTLRNSAARQSGQRSSRLSFGKPAKSGRGSGKSGSGFRSRLDDSSDEEMDGGSRFASRFEDSDDSDDEPAKVITSPSKGRRWRTRKESVDSTDLAVINENADTAGAATQRSATGKAVGEKAGITPNANGALPGTALQAGTLRPDDGSVGSPTSPTQAAKAKRGFLGFGRKRSGSVNQLPGSPLAASETAGAPTNQNSETLQDASETRGRSKSRLVRRLSTASSGSVPQLPAIDTSPFTPPPIPDQYKESYTDTRPYTSTGVPVATTPLATDRPGLGDKRQSSMTTPLQQASPIVSERTGKKKRFQGLRRFLGVHD